MRPVYTAGLDAFYVASYELDFLENFLRERCVRIGL